MATPRQKTQRTLSIAQRISFVLIKAYQWLISPLLGPHCRFYPSCSQYTLEAIQLHGCCRGIALGSKRLLRCHPGCTGGYDPVPQPATTPPKV